MVNNNESLRHDYFDWLCRIIFDEKLPSYTKALWFLFCVDFEPELEMDANRALDGLDLRVAFADDFRMDDGYISDAMSPRCSVFEMMVALSKRIEDNIMGDYMMGDRTAVWFWHMFTSLGLDALDDAHWFDEEGERIISRLNCRMYNKNGKGGLFTVKDRRVDMRDYDIWYQMCHFLNEFNSDKEN